MSKVHTANELDRSTLSDPYEGLRVTVWLGEATEGTSVTGLEHVNYQNIYLYKFDVTAVVDDKWDDVNTLILLATHLCHRLLRHLKIQTVKLYICQCCKS